MARNTLMAVMNVLLPIWQMINETRCSVSILTLIHTDTQCVCVCVCTIWRSISLSDCWANVILWRAAIGIVQQLFANIIIMVARFRSPISSNFLISCYLPHSHSYFYLPLRCHCVCIYIMYVVTCISYTFLAAHSTATATSMLCDCVCVCAFVVNSERTNGNKQLSKEIIGRLFDGLKPNRRKKHLCHICTENFVRISCLPEIIPFVWNK